MTSSLQATGMIPRWALGVMIALSLLLGLAWPTLLTAPGPVGTGSLLAAGAYSFTEGGLALLVFVAAGGLGRLAVGRLMPRSAGAGLRTVTSVALGLWLLSVAVMVLGSLVPGSLTKWLWWPVVAAGLLAAAWQARPTLEKWQPAKAFDARSLMWIPLAIAAGLWLAGATRSPGWLLTADTYDVLEYHLQLPREFINAGVVSTLDHNVYSFFPLGQEMLSLLGMALRGGAYEGTYLATLLHGMMLALAVGAVLLALRDDRPGQARFCALLLGTVPIAIYLSWLAMVELAQVAFMAVAVLWLRHWIEQRDWRSAATVGLVLGASCGFKYLSAPFIVLPVLAAMLGLAAAAKGRGLGGVLLAAVIAAAAFSPWLIRNTLAAGNPVFPVANTVLGSAHWDPMQQQRWNDGHSPDSRPPVPQPPGYQAPQQQPRALAFYNNFIAREEFGRFMLILAGLAICVMFALPRRATAWEWSLLAILAVQLGLWAAIARDMPGRFLAPAIVPLALLAGWLLAALSKVQSNPLRPGISHGGIPWGRIPAVGIVLATVLVNILTAGAMIQGYTAVARGPSNGITPGDLTMARLFAELKMPLGPQPRWVMIGDARAFYFPTGSIYATTFDQHLLAKLEAEGLTGPQMIRRLREMGVTHVWVSWEELWRLSHTYGCDPVLTAGLFESWQSGEDRPRLSVLDDLEKAGLVKITDLLGAGDDALAPQVFPAYQPWQRGRPDAKVLYWPKATLYAMPGSESIGWRPERATTATAPSPAGDTDSDDLSVMPSTAPGATGQGNN